MEWSLERYSRLLMMTAVSTITIIDLPRKKELKYQRTIGTEYYVPSITLAKKYDIRKWYNIEDNKRHYNLGIVCKTRYEAIKLANKMLAVLKEDRDNG